MLDTREDEYYFAIYLDPYQNYLIKCEKNNTQKIENPKIFSLRKEILLLYLIYKYNISIIKNSFLNYDYLIKYFI
jgi:hypothetical protein